MKVFIWKSYGDITVYHPDTPNLKESIKESLQFQGHEVNKNYSWRDLLNFIQDEIESGSDSFEYCTGFYDVEEK